VGKRGTVKTTFLYEKHLEAVGKSIDHGGPDTSGGRDSHNHQCVDLLLIEIGGEWRAEEATSLRFLDNPFRLEKRKGCGRSAHVFLFRLWAAADLVHLAYLVCLVDQSNGSSAFTDDRSPMTDHRLLHQPLRRRTMKLLISSSDLYLA